MAPATLKLAPGKEVWSDPVDLAVRQHEDLDGQPVSARADNAHGVSSRRPEDAIHGCRRSLWRRDAPVHGPGSRTTMYFFVSDVQVMAPAKSQGDCDAGRFDHGRRDGRQQRQRRVAGCALQASAGAARRHAGRRDQHGHRLQSPADFGRSRPGGPQASGRRRAFQTERVAPDSARRHQRHQLRAGVGRRNSLPPTSRSSTKPTPKASRSLAQRCCRSRTRARTRPPTRPRGRP